ncbi:MAG: 50S ribosomal protein L22 [Simkaniaceae bacterium]
MDMARAKTKYVRISPRKARLVADMVRGNQVDAARVKLMYSNLKASRLIIKTLDSAIANAETNMELQRRDLFIQEIRVDEGPTLKRAKSKCRGGRVPINKRTSHFTVVVGAKS